MVLTGITFDGRTHLHVFERGNGNDQRYKDEVLKLSVCLFKDVVGAHSMKGSARLHRPHLVDELPESEGIGRMD
ncbi:hypothetical protein TNCV_172881 [Trichonephila clavipes]|nr:hypothetical protein TNCV_172881 [Trichonephila clavipes]